MTPKPGFFSPLACVKKSEDCIVISPMISPEPEVSSLPTKNHIDSEFLSLCSLLDDPDTRVATAVEQRLRVLESSHKNSGEKAERARRRSFSDRTVRISADRCRVL